jgi:DNA-3-methyladenine glycosylase I
VQRCAWAGDDPDMVRYHDEEWGAPVHDDRTLFEFLILEGAQAGLAWITILRKRENYRKAFDNFDAGLIAEYDEVKIKALLENPGIVRNRLKVRAAITNAQTFLDVQREHGSFDSYIWDLACGKTQVNQLKSVFNAPANTPVSDAMCKVLKKRGFKFVGPTICYAFMQATGMVNDHEMNCFRYAELTRPEGRA